MLIGYWVCVLGSGYAPVGWTGYVYWVLGMCIGDWVCYPWDGLGMCIGGMQRERDGYVGIHKGQGIIINVNKIIVELVL